MPLLIVVSLLILLPAARCAAGVPTSRASVPRTTEDEPHRSCVHRVRSSAAVPALVLAAAWATGIPARGTSHAETETGTQRTRRSRTVMVALRWGRSRRSATTVALCGALLAADTGQAQYTPPPAAVSPQGVEDAPNQAPSNVRPATDTTAFEPERLVLPRLATARIPELESLLSHVSSAGAVIDAPALTSRARRAGWFPSSVRVEVRIDDGRRWDSESRLQQDYDDALALDGLDTRDITGWVADRGSTTRMQLGWDLSTLVWSGEELSIVAAARAAERDQLQRLGLATDAWLALHAARSALIASAEPDDTREATSRFLLSVARLDVLTGGWFSRELARGD